MSGPVAVAGGQPLPGGAGSREAFRGFNWHFNAASAVTVDAGGGRSAEAAPAPGAAAVAGRPDAAPVVGHGVPHRARLKVIERSWAGAPTRWNRAPASVVR